MFKKSYFIRRATRKNQNKNPKKAQHQDFLTKTMTARKLKRYTVHLWVLQFL